jgi:hypothetical protein
MARAKTSSRLSAPLSVHPAIPILKTEGEHGGEWSQQTIGPNTIKRVGYFDLYLGSEGYKRLEFEAIIKLGRILPQPRLRLRKQKPTPAVPRSGMNEQNVVCITPGA